MVETKQPFKALSKICLNNWHYIDRKILTFSEGVNFFTGHSGSGKSTVIDALQIVLYANTDGRGFFNKAAADDSDRSLIEYLRGMVNIGENNEAQYLRNRNFSSTIVLEFEQTDTHEKQCVGVVFDVETATNEIGRLFFWHKGGLLENQYRADRRCLTTAEVREYLQRTFERTDYYCGPSNERFRKQLYDIYLGGLDMEKFPRLFKRAIPFRMNIKLEDFVKEYICMEQDIHIEDLQESVMQYGQMRSKIEETMKEIRHLQEIREKYEEYGIRNREVAVCDYQIAKLEILQMQGKVRELRDRLEENSGEVSRLETMKSRLEGQQEELGKEYEEARYELRNRLHERCGKFIQVQILADMIDVKDEKWHNAVEGYMGNNKLLLVVEPDYVKDALEIYESMDKKKYFRAAVLDTEKVMEVQKSREERKERPEYAEDSLAGEVTAKEPYVQAYVEFLLGGVIKCGSVEELRRQKIGITADCMLYQGFRLQHINPDNYTRRAYIGETSMRQRIRRLEAKCMELQEERLPLQEMKEEIRKMLEYESLSLPAEDYLGWMKEISEISKKEKRKNELLEEIKKLHDESVSRWEEKKKDLLVQQEKMKENLQNVQKDIWRNRDSAERWKRAYTDLSNELTKKEKDFQRNEEMEEIFSEYLAGKRTANYDYLRQQRMSERTSLENARNDAFSALADRRALYLRNYPNRTFSTTIQDNDPYDRLLENLSCDELEEYRQAAKEQARSAVEHFKDDFIYKIRSAIREAYQKKDELNRIISRLDFGKDKYQFVITKNKGPDGKYYKMFMDDSLSINPAQLTGSMENQLNLFTMEHEEEYGDMMNELIQIFIPPEDATREELDQAKKNMEKYADYRTYLSFDMQQIVHGEKEMKIGLSRMIKKNSGGEGQNPLYIALLASFAQIYRINLSPKIRRPATIRLVVLDEAFSKMDAEKVASCISLIRGLGFQAIISATNDKIQNYLENVDKTFVYANPNKRHISIQEFERAEYGQLRGEEERPEHRTAEGSGSETGGTKL